MELPRFRLFILGSGFSKAAGHPLGVELLDMVRHGVQEKFRRFDWDGPLEQEISEWRELYPTADLTLESVFAYSHRKHFLKLIGSDEYFSHGSRSIAAAREVIQAILSHPIDTDAVELYRSFASQLRPTDLVYTFNYDTVLEDTLDSIDKPYSLTPEWWLADDEQAKDSDAYPARYIDILKLHGSIDWYDRNYHDETVEYCVSQGVEPPDSDPLFGPNAYVPTEPLARGPVSTGYSEELLARVFRVPEFRRYYPFRSTSLTEVPFLLPPAYDKILGHDPIRELWSDMHRTHAVFSMIAVIGYSMPSYDAYAYEALGRILIDYQHGGDRNWYKQPRVPLQIVTRANSEAEVFRGLPFLNSDRTRVWTQGFSSEALDWLDWDG